jgi:hypothetical protein
MPRALAEGEDELGRDRVQRDDALCRGAGAYGIAEVVERELARHLGARGAGAEHGEEQDEYRTHRTKKAPSRNEGASMHVAERVPEWTAACRRHRPSPEGPDVART